MHRVSYLRENARLTIECFVCRVNEVDAGDPSLALRMTIGASGWQEIHWEIGLLMGGNIGFVHVQSGILGRNKTGGRKGPPNPTSSTLAPTDLEA